LPRDWDDGAVRQHIIAPIGCPLGESLGAVLLHGEGERADAADVADFTELDDLTHGLGEGRNALPHHRLGDAGATGGQRGGDVAAMIAVGHADLGPDGAGIPLTAGEDDAGSVDQEVRGVAVQQRLDLIAEVDVGVADLAGLGARVLAGGDALEGAEDHLVGPGGGGERSRGSERAVDGPPHGRGGPLVAGRACENPPHSRSLGGDDDLPLRGEISPACGRDDVQRDDVPHLFGGDEAGAGDVERLRRGLQQIDIADGFQPVEVVPGEDLVAVVDDPEAVGITDRSGEVGEAGGVRGVLVIPGGRGGRGAVPNLRGAGLVGADHIRRPLRHPCQPH